MHQPYSANTSLMHAKATHFEETLNQLSEERLLPSIDEDGKSKSIHNILMGNEEYIVDTKGIIVSSNLEAVSITGYQEWEHISIFYPEGDVALAARDLAVAEERGKFLIDNYFLDKAGNLLPAKIKFSAIRNTIKSLTGFRIVMKSPSNQASYRTKLKRLKLQYLNLFQNSAFGIFRFDTQHWKNSYGKR
jgi:hypothetical protein